MSYLLILITILSYPSPTSINSKGYFQLKNNKLIEAEQTFKTVIINYPDYVTAYNNLGIVYLRTKKFKLAEKMFKYAIKLKNNYSKAYYNLAVTYFNMNEYIKSLEILKKLYKIDKEYIKSRLKKEKARKKILKKLEKDPNNPQLLKALKLIDKM